MLNVREKAVGNFQIEGSFEVRDVPEKRSRLQEGMCWKVAWWAPSDYTLHSVSTAVAAIVKLKHFSLSFSPAC